MKDYDAPVHESARPDLERYMFRHRPVLMRSPTDLVLLTHRSDAAVPHRPFAEMSKTVKAITEKYLWKSAGIGTQAFRHLAATSILKTPAGTMKVAALVLADKESTVEAHYSGMRSGDGVVRMGELLAYSYRKM